MAAQNADLVPSGRHDQRAHRRRQACLRSHDAGVASHRSLGVAVESQNIHDAADGIRPIRLRNVSCILDEEGENPRNRGEVDGILRLG